MNLDSWLTVCLFWCFIHSSYSQNDQNQKECGKNEMYFCRRPYPPDTCAAQFIKHKHIPNQVCEYGCHCKGGYLRIGDSSSPCIPSNMCPRDWKVDRKTEVKEASNRVCPQNEYMNDCYSPCERRCATRFRGDNTSCAAFCSMGCSCISGYLRNDDGICVPIDQCSKPLCDYGEEFMECGPSPGCEKTCDNFNNSCNSCIQKCTPGCFCSNGTLRGPGLTCLKPEKCPNCGRNEVADTCYDKSCERTCANRYIENLRCNAHCQIGCSCAEGYYRHDNGTCVPGDECSPPKCGEGEVFLECGSSCPPTCETFGDTCKVCTLQCVKGCFCAPGKVRGPDGICVEKKDCPIPDCPGQNEYWAQCPDNCPPQICSSIYSKYDCTGQNECCTPQCRCINGYYRNETGVCISTNQCLNNQDCNDPNAEIKECGSACDPTCDNRNPTCTKQCVLNKCQCKKGYVLDKINGTCILAEKCPRKSRKYRNRRKCRDPNAEMKRCGSACDPTCANPNPVCIQRCNSNKCQCKRGFILDKPNGKCILIDQCPSECEDRNAERSLYSCVSACQPTCERPDAIQTCTSDVCIQNACICKQGYILDKVGGKCVEIDQCPTNACPSNSSLVPCKVQCPSNYCPTDYSAEGIICDPALPCPPGCACNLGYRRLSRNDTKCILAEECPALSCPRPFEEYKPCPNECLSGYCDDIGQEDVPCNTLVHNCQPTCGCIKGYYRSRDSHTCIPAKQCPNYSEIK